MTQELFSQQNIYKAIMAGLVLAMGYMFNMIIDNKHMMIVSDQAQQANKKQWRRISGAEREISYIKGYLDGRKDNESLYHSGDTSSEHMGYSTVL